MFYQWEFFGKKHSRGFRELLPVGRIRNVDFHSCQ